VLERQPSDVKAVPAKAALNRQQPSDSPIRGNAPSRSHLADIKTSGTSISPPLPEVASADLLHVASTASHYDERQIARQSGEDKDSRIAILRKLNNWAKTCLISYIYQGLKFASGVAVQSARVTSGELRLFIDKLRAENLDSPNLAALTAPVATTSVSAWARQKPTRQQTSVDFLDIACGRGGDLNKATGNPDFDIAYMGLDISQLAIDDADGRMKGLQQGQFCKRPRKNIKQFFLHKCDNTVEFMSGSCKANQFNVVWCQFAMHYFCDTEAHFRGLISNVSRVLRAGGYYCAIFPNPYVIIKAATTDLLSGCETVSIACMDTLPASTDGDIPFGIKYEFTMCDALTGCVECLVPVKQVIEIANGMQLNLQKIVGLHEYMRECSEDNNSMGIRGDCGVIGPKSPQRPASEAEWKAIGLYCVAIWQKL